jgi:diguanylate cyclase (GGDEF)-like protein/PAS domain S-box-containing protein
MILPPNEEQRLETLRSYNIMDTLPEQAYDDITHLASHICEAPIALVSLIEHDRQWFKSKVGLDVEGTSRDVSFCSHAILQPEVMTIVPDALADSRFAHNPFVTGAPHIRFYAGTPLRASNGEALGTLCVIDRKPRELTDGQKEALSALARQVMAHLELRHSHAIGLAREAFLDAIVDHLPAALFCKDAERDYRITVWNNIAESMFGLTSEQVIGRTSQEIFPERTADRTLAIDREVIATGQVVEFEEVEIENSGNDPIIAHSIIVPVPDEMGKPRYVLGMCEDITQRRRAEMALRESEQRFQTFMDNSPVAAYIKDSEGRFLYANHPLLRHLNRTSVEVLGHYDKELWPTAAADIRAHDQSVVQGHGPITVEETTPSPDGGDTIWLSFKFPLTAANGETLLGGMSIDITERKYYERQLEDYQLRLEEAIARLEEIARTDHLTGLHNKGAFDLRLLEEFERARRYNLSLSLLMLDVDHFKQYNDTFGHPAGDETLRGVAEILKTHARPSDFPSRYGGEEFVVILSNTSVEGAYIVAERLRRAVENASWPKRRITASLGVASVSEDITSPAQLVEAADQALYKAKTRGRNQVARHNPTPDAK